MAPTIPAGDLSSRSKNTPTHSTPSRHNSSSSPSSSLSNSGSDNNRDADTPASASSNIPTLPLPQKPAISRTAFAPGSSALLSRLSSFLPELAAANASLEEDRAAGRLEERNIENVDNEGGQYIEMNLGLGVLEEKDPNATSSSGSDSDTSSDASDDDEDENDVESTDAKTTTEEGRRKIKTPQSRSKDKTVMDSLMGTKPPKSKTKPTIEEVQEG